MKFQDLEAWKLAHQLVLELYRATKPIEERDPDLTQRLRYAAIRASGRIAFGSGSGNWRMFIAAAGQAQSYFAEISYLLGLVKVLELLPEEECIRLDHLQSMAMEDTMKLINSLTPRPPQQ